ncbi:hypothetical protein [Microbacterium alcoholitolerans]|uniref:hypothetical protein n=1 Tax=unclassified Microbacterium TaxID=2609290 RepID=UPI003D1795CE
MVTHRSSAALAGVVTFGLLLAGCSGASDPGSDTSAPAAPPAASDFPAPDSTETGADGKGQAAASDGSGVAVDEARDGTWQVGDAGEVDFTAQNGSLSLGEVRPADGWEQRIADEQPDEIEVHFTQGDQEWKFEVEADDGGLQISKQLKIRNASSAEFQVGSAATLTFTADGSTLSVADLTPASGWTVVKQDESADDIELGFRNSAGDGEAEFEAETDRGNVKVEISQKMRGPIG